ncbi:MAG: hypothetical protein ACE5OZ_19995 [Candidatus Heimdallarchaeota archaeon]
MRAKIKRRTLGRRLFLLLILLFALGSYMEGSLGNLGDGSENIGSELEEKFTDDHRKAATEHNPGTLEDDDEDDETTTTTEETQTTEENDEDDDTSEEKDDDDDGVDDDRESDAGRQIDFDPSENEVKIESELETGDQKDKFVVEFKREDEPSIKFDYKSKSEGIETELSLKVEFLSLVEFSDSNGNRYLDINDTEYSTYSFTKDLFSDLKWLKSTTDDNESLYKIWTQTTDGVFLIRLYVVSGFGTINGSTITPTEVKIDIEIHNYPFANNGSLALRLELKTEVETEIEKKDESPDEAEGLATNEEALAFTSSSYLGFFSWAMNVTVDGVEKPVVASPYAALETEIDNDDDETELRQKGEISLTYPHGNDIIHDPKIGVVTETAYTYIGQLTELTTISFFFFEINAKPGFLGLTMISTLVLGAMVFIHRRQSQPPNE